MKRAVKTMVLSAAGLIGIASYEGYSDRAYIPVQGDVYTIGFGHTGAVSAGDVVTVPRALSMLHADIEGAQDAVKRNVLIELSQDEFDAYTSFVFNVGVGAFERSTLLKRLNNGDRAGACSELRRWVYAGGKRVQGLVNRREREYQQCMRGVND